ncbi:MAG: hypothetical protein U5N55_05250 [Cypionkella sp.]|nr:hypothetical protein [Cypionkella sp.]
MIEIISLITVIFAGFLADGLMSSDETDDAESSDVDRVANDADAAPQYGFFLGGGSAVAGEDNEGMPESSDEPTEMDANETLTGGDLADTMFGQGGDDMAIGGIGNDVMGGREGEDTLFGDFGDDYLIGGEGDDSADGGDGADTIYGDDGKDALTGAAGADMLYAGADDDVLVGILAMTVYLAARGRTPCLVARVVTRWTAG